MQQRTKCREVSHAQLSLPKVAQGQNAPEMSVTKAHYSQWALRTHRDYLLFPYQSRFIWDQQGHQHN